MDSTLSQILNLVFVTLGVSIASILGSVFSWIRMFRMLPKEVEAARIKNAKEKSDALSKLDEEVEQVFTESSEYRSKFRNALKEIEKLKREVGEVRALRKEIFIVKCEQDNTHKEMVAYRALNTKLSSQVSSAGLIPEKLGKILKKDCVELAKGMEDV